MNIFFTKFECLAFINTFWQTKGLNDISLIKDIVIANKHMLRLKKC